MTEALRVGDRVSHKTRPEEAIGEIYKVFDSGRVGVVTERGDRASYLPKNLLLAFIPSPGFPPVQEPVPEEEPTEPEPEEPYQPDNSSMTETNLSACPCGQPHDNWPGQAGQILCQTCWEKECNESWWVQVAGQKKIEKCRSCGAEIYWEKTPAGKNCPFDIETGESHFKTCPDATKWSKRSANATSKSNDSAARSPPGS